MLFANPNGVQGNVVSPGVNELIIQNPSQTWDEKCEDGRCPGQNQSV